MEFLREAGDGHPIDLTGKRVIVIGGSNVAMDCTHTARRLGETSMECVYRRRLADMTALPEEVADAAAEGCQLSPLKAPVRIEQDADGQVTALIVQPQLISTVKRGRPSPTPADLPEERIPCDVILVAIGDAVSGPATVIKAVAAGKVAAANIDQALGYHHDVYDEVPSPQVAPTLPPTGRVELQSRTFAEAAEDFDIDRVGGAPLVGAPSSHTTVRTVRYTAVPLTYAHLFVIVREEQVTFAA